MGKPEHKQPEYKPAVIAIDLCDTSLIEAALEVGPSFTYDLCVGVRAVFTAMRLSRVAYVKDNPFSPHINVRVIDGFGPDEWCLCANGKAYGSEGA